jgi:mono/diheme cytochrome c family protein/peroxiredoxin
MPLTNISRATCAVAALVVLLAITMLLSHPTGQALEPQGPVAALPADDAQDSQDSTASEFPAASLPNADGLRLELAQLRGDKATLLVSLSTQCPISNGYIPTLNRLAETYGPRGVAVIGLNPNAGQGLRDLKVFQHDYQLKFPLLKDAGAQVCSQLKLTICPEVCLIDSDGRVQYGGRIDDRYSRRGGAAARVRSADLENALEDLLSGRPVKVAKTTAVGCPIQKGDTELAADPNAAVTYARDVARILQKNCQECHREGGLGPFALETYQQAVSWADDIRRFTADRTMPPWKPVAGQGDFAGARALSQEEIDLLAQWVQAGTPRGDDRDLPPPRNFSNDWRLGTPDLVLSPNEEFELAADGPDVYRCFILPAHFDQHQFVTAIEVKPGNARVVHHVLVFIDNSGRSLALDAKDAGPGYATTQGSPGFLPAGSLGGWAPGNTRDYLPSGMAKLVPRGSKIVMQVHYHKTGKPETDRTQLGLYFAKEPVTRLVRAIAVTPPGGPLSGMTIPAGDANYQVTGSLVLPDDFLAVCITPHMHLLGKDMKVLATLPDGSTRPLVEIRNWDFNWQETYRYRQPVLLPKGTQLDLVAHFDNSESNPNNPNSPPQVVRWGEQTTDEMCIAFLELAPLREARGPEDLQPPTPGEVLRFILQSQYAAGSREAGESGRRLRDLIGRWREAQEQKKP